MAANNTIDEIRRYLNADSLHYLSQEGLVKATKLPQESFCTACWDGKYPVPYDPATDKEIIERRKARACGLVDSLTSEKKQIKLF
jgi:amidophosphoribosyltransferase